MNALSQNLPAEELEVADMDNPPDVDAFSTSLAPVNHTETQFFRVKDRICCVGVMASFVVLMRLLLAN